MATTKTTKRSKKSQKEVGLLHGFRSGLEDKLATELTAKKLIYTYESVKLSFVQPSKRRTYTPDFILDKLDGSKLYIETKGRFIVSDRQKMLMVIEQHNTLDIRMLFSNAKAKISKTSHTTYADWCIKNGIKWAQYPMPDIWLAECVKR
jgi:arginyl-tRNA synthetase